VSFEHSPTRDRKTANAAINDPSYTVNEFCAAERMSLWPDVCGMTFHSC
jgi:hypothetical protein